MSTMTDAGREAYIKNCGELMQKAYGAGNRAEADRWLKAQNDAIRARSAAQVASMEGCYFAAQGEKARAALEESHG